jgi:hypothetical protein
MRTLTLCCLLLCSSIIAAQAQSPTTTATPKTPPQPAPPGVDVLKHSWSKERINWEADPFSGAVENFDDVRRRMADQRRVERARTTGNAAEAAKVEREMRSEQVIRSRAPAPPRYAFLYKISIRNNGSKAIKELDWDYVFNDAATGLELGRREFTAVEKIGPGKSRELSFLVSSPPAMRISVQSLDKKEREGLAEQIVLVRVLYEDGTVWQRQ